MIGSVKRAAFAVVLAAGAAVPAHTQETASQQAVPSVTQPAAPPSAPPVVFETLPPRSGNF